MSGWVCAACGVRNARAGHCELCGAVQPATATQVPGFERDAPDAEKQAKWRDHAQCAWMRRSSSRCGMRAVVFLHPSDHYGLCSWHAQVEQNPHAESYEEFERWCAGLRRALYCTGWTHHPTARLWDVVHGQDALGEASACDHSGCPHREPEISDAQVAAFRLAVQRGGWARALAALRT